MKHNQDNVVNQAAMLLLVNARPVELGMPARLIHELVFGKYAALTVEDILGGPEHIERSMLGEYKGKKGYTFSFGNLSEESYPSNPDDDKSLPVLRFEFIPLDLLVTFPQSAQLEDLFMWLYRNHPLYHPEFDCDEAFGDFSVLSFQSKEGCGGALRGWMASVFIPSIWPDLLAEATRIVNEKIAAAIAQSSDGSFKELLLERGRFQLCGDPAELQYEALKHQNMYQMT